jgi:hydrogenase-1 operon protein HyaF
MSELDKISVVEEVLSGNVPALLTEIQQALTTLLAEDRDSQIDLNTLPLTPADENLLFATLGTGEVSIKLDTLGESLIQETSFPGVWLVEHKHPDGETLTRHLEITWIPAIVKAQREDVEMGLGRLSTYTESAPRRG